MTPLRCLLLAGLCASAALAAALDPLHLDSQHIRDSSNRIVILRGVVTITLNNDGKPYVMTGADYDRIKAWGFNVQQIRLEGCRLGLLPPCKADPAYLDKLESWVNMAEEKGIYTFFKVTTYDVPGLGFQQQFKPGAWDKLWDKSSGYQEQFIAGWTPVWKRFKGRTAVLGYDLLNECLAGSNTTGFVHNYLFPFYRKAAAALAEVDPVHFFVFQPPIRSDDRIAEPLGVKNALFAPHFYPYAQDPDVMYRNNILKEAELVKTPVVVGEYGLPNIPFDLPGATVKASTPERDQGDALLFDQSLMSTIKTWYTSVGNWWLIDADGKEHPRFQYFSRPFPQRTAGTPKTFSMDFQKHEWSFEWTPDPAIKSPTVIFVNLKRHFPSGFRISTNDGLKLESDPKSSSGLKGGGKGYRYDFGSEILTVDAATSAGVRSLKITRVR